MIKLKDSVVHSLLPPHLNLGDDNPPGLLVQPLIVPMGVEVGELGGKSVIIIL